MTTETGTLDALLADLAAADADVSLLHYHKERRWICLIVAHGIAAVGHGQDAREAALGAARVVADAAYESLRARGDRPDGEGGPPEDPR